MHQGFGHPHHGHHGHHGHGHSGLPVPYSLPISPSFTHGTQIQVVGTPTGDRFEVNLKTYQNDIVLHFNPRFSDNAVVLNTCQNGAWGQEDRRPLTLQRGVRFTLTIVATHHGLSISVNNMPLGEFHQRVPIHSAQTLEVKGDISLESAQAFPGMGGPMGFPSMGMNMPFLPTPVAPFGGAGVNFGYPSAPPVHVQSYPMGGGGGGVPSIQTCQLHIGSRIFVRGHIHPGAHRFELNLLQGHSDGDDIAFHFNPRFDSRTIVKNYRRNGQWGSEENQPFPAFMPLAPGAQIDLQVSCLPDRYTVFMNNHLIAEYYHKISPGAVQAIQYKGDITITSIGQL